MTRKTTNLLLLISLVFNLAVVSMFTFHFFRMREFRPPMPRRGDTPHAKIRKQMKEVKPLHQSYIKAKMDFFKELRSDELDLKKAQEKLDITVQKQILMEKKLGEDLVELRQELTAEEFRKLGSRMRFEPKYPSPENRPRRKKMNPRED